MRKLGTLYYLEGNILVFWQPNVQMFKCSNVPSGYPKNSGNVELKLSEILSKALKKFSCHFWKNTVRGALIRIFVTAAGIAYSSGWMGQKLGRQVERWWALGAGNSQQAARNRTCLCSQILPHSHSMLHCTTRQQVKLASSWLHPYIHL